MNFKRALTIFRNNPGGALRDWFGRIRLLGCPTSGSFIGSLRPGPVWFHYELALSPMIRAMYVNAYETYVVSLIRRLLKPGDVFVDVGANVGYLSAVAASCLSPSGRILSFEPNPEVFPILQANRDLNQGYPGWLLFQMGIGSEETTGEPAASKDNLGWNSLVTTSIPETADRSPSLIFGGRSESRYGDEGELGRPDRAGED